MLPETRERDILCVISGQDPGADSDNAWPGAPLWPRLSNFISSVTSIPRMNGPIVHQWPMTGVCSDQ